MQHNWRTIVPSRDPAHWKRGTEIEVSIPAGFMSRFAIYSVRQSRWVKDPKHWDGGYVETDATYRVRDSDTVTDAEVKAGTRPKVIGEFPTLDECEKFLLTIPTNGPISVMTVG